MKLDKILIFGLASLLLGGCLLEDNHTRHTKEMSYDFPNRTMETLSSVHYPELNALDHALDGFTRKRTRGLKLRYEYVSKNGYRIVFVADKSNFDAVDSKIDEFSRAIEPRSLSDNKVGETMSILMQSCVLESPDGVVLFEREWKSFRGSKPNSGSIIEK